MLNRQYRYEQTTLETLQSRLDELDAELAQGTTCPATLAAARSVLGQVRQLLADETHLQTLRRDAEERFEQRRLCDEAEAEKRTEPEPEPERTPRGAAWGRFHRSWF